MFVYPLNVYFTLLQKLHNVKQVSCLHKYLDGWGKFNKILSRRSLSRKLTLFARRSGSIMPVDKDLHSKLDFNTRCNLRSWRVQVPNFWPKYWPNQLTKYYACWNQVPHLFLPKTTLSLAKESFTTHFHLRTSLCKHQTSWEMKIFNLP